METGKEEQVEGTTAPVAETETQATTPTQEEIDAMLLKARDEGKADAQQEYQGIQRTVAKKDLKIQELEKLTSQPKTPISGKFNEELLGILEAQQTQLGESNPRIAELKRQIILEKQRETQQTRYQVQDAISGEEREELDETIRDAGFDPSDPIFAEVNKAFENARDNTGMFERAHRKLAVVLKTAKPKSDTPKETEEQRINRLSDEKLAKELEARGLTTTDTGGPSGSGGGKIYKQSELAAEQVKISQLPPAERKKARQDISNAFNEGRVQLDKIKYKE